MSSFNRYRLCSYVVICCWLNRYKWNIDLINTHKKHTHTCLYMCMCMHMYKYMYKYLYLYVYKYTPTASTTSGWLSSDGARTSPLIQVEINYQRPFYISLQIKSTSFKPLLNSRKQRQSYRLTIQLWKFSQ